MHVPDTPGSTLLKHLSKIKILNIKKKELERMKSLLRRPERATDRVTMIEVYFVQVWKGHKENITLHSYYYLI